MKIDSLSIEKAENGYLICYTIKTKNISSNKNTFDNYSYDYKKEVFDVDTEDEAEDMSEFKNRLLELMKNM